MTGPDPGTAPGRGPASPAVYPAEAIRSLLGPDEAIQAVRTAFLSTAARSVISPAPWNLELPALRGEVHVKGGYLRGVEHIVVKLATGFYDNPGLGLPSTDGLSLVLSASTGTLSAVLLDGGYLTDLRTGAAGAVATDLLARRDANRVAVIGVGAQARYQLSALLRLRRPTHLALWGRDPDRARTCARWAERTGDWSVSVAPTVADAVQGAEIIITVTPSADPLVFASMVRPGSHITAVGSDGTAKREIDPALMTAADLVAVDSLEQSESLGELKGVRERHGRLALVGDILAGIAAGRTEPDEITIADLTGIGAQDVAIADTACAMLSGRADPGER